MGCWWGLRTTLSGVLQLGIKRLGIKRLGIKSSAYASHAGCDRAKRNQICTPRPGQCASSGLKTLCAITHIGMLSASGIQNAAPQETAPTA